jgi:hypothetical protein
MMGEERETLHLGDTGVSFSLHFLFKILLMLKTQQKQQQKKREDHDDESKQSSGRGAVLHG